MTPTPARTRVARGSAARPAVECLEGRRHLAATPTGALASGDATAVILPPRQVEKLDRGLVAVRTGTSTAYVGWRLFGDDASNVAFNLYRVNGTGAPSKRNATPITATTNFNDTGVSFTAANTYFVRTVINGIEGPDSARFTVAANEPTRQYLSVPMQIPAGGRLPGTTDTVEHDYTYSANDTSVGDVDGDGQYELIVKWDPSDSKDNSQDGYTGNVYIDAYKLNGTRLWRIDLGRNIRAGAHYTQFMVYDFDGDGKAEVAMKTAPGTIDGAGNPVLLGTDLATADYRNSEGYILSGPEYLTMFNGQTGANMATVPFAVARGTVSSWGDGYGNRVDRFLGGVAYLDGVRPSLIMARGYYTRATLNAWDWRNGKLTQRWLFDSDSQGSQYRGQGDHSLSIADVDDDGRDEVIYGAMAVDDNGRGMYSTGYGHGDALHVGDLDPSRPGLEVFNIHEPGYPNIAASYRDARTGAAIFTLPQSTTSTEGPGRGVGADIYAGNPGPELWVAGGGVAGGIYDRNGVNVGRQPGSVNFLAWWDADPVRELLNSNQINKYGITGDTRLLTASGASSINGTKSTPNLSGDLLGDWREEVIWRSTDSSELRIYTTTTLATNRLYTLMHDLQYRVAIAWQNVAYNQPPHPSFFIGHGMAPPPKPNIFYAAQASPEAALLDVYQAEQGTLAGGSFIEATSPGFNGTAYVNFPTNGGSLEWSNLPSGGGGAATIRLRYALAGSASRSGRLLINGVAQTVTFAPTGGFNAWQTLSLPVTLDPYQPLTVRLESTGQDLPNVDELQVRRLADTFAPTSVAATFDYAPRPNQIRIRFGEDVSASVALGDLVINRIGSTATIAPVDVTYDVGTNTAIFTLPPLADGNYRATMAAGAVRDAAGNLLASPVTVDFYVLAGDINRDRAVNFDDLLIIAQNYGQGGKLFGDGDLNSDGDVNFDDLLVLAQGYGTSLAVAGATSPVSPAAATTTTAAARRR